MTEILNGIEVECKMVPTNKLYETKDLQRSVYAKHATGLQRVLNKMYALNFRATLHWTRIWEWVTVILSTHLVHGDRILDVGGCRSPLGFYLRELGCRVTVLDTESPEPFVPMSYYDLAGIEYIQADALDVSRNWNIGNFECILSTCVLEHFDLTGDIVDSYTRLLSTWLDHSQVTANTVDFYGKNHAGHSHFNEEQLNSILANFDIGPGSYDVENWRKYFDDNFPEESGRIPLKKCFTCASLIVEI